MKPRSLVSTCALCALALATGGCQRTSDVKTEIASARDLIGRHEYRSAIIQAKNALQTDPRNAAGRLLLGQALLDSGDPVAAEVELRKALEAGGTESQVLPWLAKAVLAQGKPRPVVDEFASKELDDAASSADLKTTVASAYTRLGERDNALEALDAALKDWPEHAPASLLKARLQAAGGDTAGALTVVEGVLAREPKNAAALTTKADLQRLGQHDLDGALKTYRSAIDADPRDLTAHVAVVEILLDRHDVAGARAAFDKLRAAYPRSLETLLFEARFAYLDGKFDHAVDLAEQLLKVYPNDPRVLLLAGGGKMHEDALAQAEIYLSRAVTAAPSMLAPREMLAQVYLRTGQPAKVLTVLQPVVDSPQADANSLTLAGQAYLQTGDLAQSEASFARAAKVDPKSAKARAALALTQMALGQVESAFAELESLAASDPGPIADLALISARMRRNDLAGALTAVAGLQKKQPDKPVAPALRGAIQARMNQPDLARASFEQALAIDKLYFPATAGLVALDMAAGHPGAGKKRFEDLLQADPKNFRAMLGLAELQARTGEPEAVVSRTLAAAVSASPGEPAPRRQLVGYLLSRQDVKGALAAAQDAAAALPNSVEVLDLLGTAQLQAGDPQQAVSTFGKLAGLRPDQPDVQLHLAQACVAAGDLDGARQSLETALRISPGLVPAQRGLAELALRQKRPDEAMAIARSMQKTQPKQPDGYLLEAHVDTAQGRTAAAVAVLRTALPLDQGNGTAIQLHRALLADRHGDDADRLAASWKKDHPRDAGFLYYLGDVALARGDYAAAEADYRSVVDVQPDNALALNNVAWLMTKQGQAGAVAIAEKANSLLPERPAIMDTLALALANANQTQRAIEVQKKAIEIAPNEESLRLTLAKVYMKSGNRADAMTELDRLSKLGDKFPSHAEVDALRKSL